MKKVEYQVLVGAMNDKSYNPITREFVTATRNQLKTDLELPMKDDYTEFIMSMLKKDHFLSGKKSRQGGEKKRIVWNVPVGRRDAVHREGFWDHAHVVPGLDGEGERFALVQPFGVLHNQRPRGCFAPPSLYGSWGP